MAAREEGNKGKDNERKGEAARGRCGGGSIYVASYRSLGIGTNLFPEITIALFSNPVPRSHHKIKHDYSMTANFQIISETIICEN